MRDADDVAHDAWRQNRIRAQRARSDCALDHDTRQDGREARIADQLHDAAEHIDFEARRQEHVLVLRGGIEHAAQAVPLGRQHQFEFGQLGQLDRVRQVRAVCRTGGEHHFFVEDRVRIERELAARLVDERRIELAAGDPVDEGRAVAVGDGDFDVRIFLVIARQ